MRKRLFHVAIAVLAVLPAACRERAAPVVPAAAACSDVIPGCRADRLPNVILTGDERDGAMAGVDDADLTGIISFDEALRAAGREDFHGDADSVRVVLGTADPGALHWGDSSGVYYAIEWNGVCMPAVGGLDISASPVDPGSAATPGAASCEPRRWGTVIDARTGSFIVGGA